MEAFAALAAWLVMALLGVVATVWWARKLWKPASNRPAWKKALGAFLAMLAMLGGFGMAMGPVKAVTALRDPSVDPSQRAASVAEAISEGMNEAALGLAAWVTSAVAIAIMSFKRKRKPD